MAPKLPNTSVETNRQRISGIFQKTNVKDIVKMKWKSARHLAKEQWNDNPASARGEEDGADGGMS